VVTATPESTATATATETPTATETSTATDKSAVTETSGDQPGFGVLAGLAGGAVGLVRLLSKEEEE